MTFVDQQYVFFYQKYDIVLSKVLHLFIKNMTFFIKKYARKMIYFQNLEKKAPAAGNSGREAQR